jgi:WD40 repeat protein
VRLWDVEAGRPFANVSGTVSDPWTLAISADGRSLAAINGDGMVRMWDVASGRRTGELLRRVVRTVDLAGRLAFIPTEK